MLRTRIVTAVVLWGVLMPLFLFAPAVLICAAMLLICVLASWEWARLGKAQPKAAVAFALLCGLVIAVLWWKLEEFTLVWVAGASLLFWVWVALLGLRKGLPKFLQNLPGALALLGVLVCMCVRLRAGMQVCVCAHARGRP